MYISEDFVFLHPPKTGGSFVDLALREVLGPSAVPDAPKHGTRQEIPAEHNHKPVVMIIREPLAYYTSVYRFGWWIGRHAGDWNWARWDDTVMSGRYSNYPYLGFDEFVAAILDIQHRILPQPIKYLASRMPMGQLLISTVEYGCRNPVRALQDLAHRGVKSTLNDHFQDVTMLHTERLGEDLAEFLGTVGINPTQTAEVTKRPPVRPLNAPGGQPLNNGHGQPYDASDRSHLTDELVSRILQAEFQYLNLWPEYRTGPLPIAVSSRNQV